jgi:beta-glucosidase-like glycosyl hydrolase
VIRSFIKAGLYDVNGGKGLPDNLPKNVKSAANTELAIKGVERSTVLLQNNNNTLPLQKKKGMKVLVVGILLVLSKSQMPKCHDHLLAQACT